MKDISVEKLIDIIATTSTSVSKLLKAKDMLIRRFEDMEKEVEKHKRTAICMYCGTVQQTKDGQEKLAMIIEHMAVCEKHPVPKLLAEKAELEKELESWRNSRDGIMAENEALALKAINLTCCGNCKKHHEDSNAVRMDRCNSRRWGYYCDHYQTDSLSREERMGK